MIRLHSTLIILSHSTPNPFCVKEIPRNPLYFLNLPDKGQMYSSEGKCNMIKDKKTPKQTNVNKRNNVPH